MTEPLLQIHGIHHVTAIASDPQRNLDFYTRVLGLRLVKLTVNFDDPGTYHFYFGDHGGRPGTILTFFPWPRAKAGKHGAGQINQVSYAIPPGSLDYWSERLKQHGVMADNPSERFGEPVLSFLDPDRMVLELIETDWAEGAGPAVATDGAEGNDPPAGMTIRGFHSVSLFEHDVQQTRPVLVDLLGFTEVEHKGSRTRFQAGAGGGDNPGHWVDLVHLPAAPEGGSGAGTVHHVAWRVSSSEEQIAWRNRLIAAGYDVTDVRDRQYFKSIYFREPGGVLFEMATDGPGFAIDEPLNRLGSTLKLPTWFEAQRADLERRLPKLRLPGAREETGAPEENHSV